MGGFNSRQTMRLIMGVSVLALTCTPGVAAAQDTDAAATVGQPGDSEIQQQPPADQTETGDDIVITGIRASLREAVDIKRNAQGVVDAISAEDIGKFPDTNLAESLQRITGVSIDRSNGEGSLVTVRGFGPEFNLVTLNGRQMPTSNIFDGGSAPSSRSFDFANLASEGIAAVEVYKSGRAAVATGGIGSTINIRTPRPVERPGTRGSIAAKGVLDTSRNGDDQITPEVSGIFSTTFGDTDQFGVLVAGAYQKRKASTNSAGTGTWRDGYLGSENNWGSLPQPGTPGSERITNRPEPTDVYQVPQQAAYSLTDIDRERINGQAVLQYRPVESLTATIDYTYSRNRVKSRTNDFGVWFNFGETSSEWTDGPVAGPVFYSEVFGRGKDLSYGGGFTANQSENKSLGANLTWEAPGGVTVSLDYHDSSAESKPTSKYGSSVAVGTAIFDVLSQRVEYDQDMPVIAYEMFPDVDPLNPANVLPTGNAFRNAYGRNDIEQIQLKGRYDHDGGFLESLDFGVSFVDSKVRSAYGFIQNDTWGGIGGDSPAQRAAAQAALADDIFRTITIPDKFKGLSGANADNITQEILAYDFDRIVDLIVNQYNVCGPEQNCLAPYNTDRRIREKILAPYLQTSLAFDAFSMPTRVIAGVRYEHTSINSAALVPIPTGTAWVAANEFSISFSGDQDFTRLKGEYDNWLPAIDFDIEPIDNVKLRASYSHTITRAGYGDLQGGQTLSPLFRIEFGDGQRGNPGLLPYKSKNIDLSAEWYYGRESYISVGYFNKKVKNFIGSDRIIETAFGLRNPADGPRYRAALAAVGNDNIAIRNYIIANFPSTVQTLPNGTVAILGVPEDDLLNFQFTQPVNNDETATIDGWEFAIQHNFWDTGFGTILNYTIVNGDATYDNTLPSSAGAQFALTGLSDSANAVLFFDKFGLQARVAYNWRDEFLSGGGPNPNYTEAYGQIDASASYEFVPGFTAFVEAINLTGESRRGHQRSENNITFAQPGFARYSAGLRFNFGGR